MPKVKMICHVGVREDNGAIVEAFLYTKEMSPRVRILTHDRVRVVGGNTFEFEADAFTLPNTLTKALAAIILVGLTPEQRDALARAVPELTLNR